MYISPVVWIHVLILRMDSANWTEFLSLPILIVIVLESRFADFKSNKTYI